MCFCSLHYLYSYTGCDNAVVHDVCVFLYTCVRETLLLVLAIALTHFAVSVLWCFRIRVGDWVKDMYGMQKLGIYILCSLHCVFCYTFGL